MGHDNENTQHGLPWSAITAGIAGAAVALGVAELGAGLLDSVTSPVIAVGDFMVDTTPGAIARFSIDLFGSRQKTILVWGVTVAVLLFGGITGGIVSERRKGRVVNTALLITIYTVFAIVGGLAMGREPEASWFGSFAVIALAAVAGIATTKVLLERLAAPAGEDTDTEDEIVGTDTEDEIVGTDTDDEIVGDTSDDETVGATIDRGAPNSSRRRFATGVAGAFGAALATGWIGRYLGSQSNVGAARAQAASVLDVQSTPVPETGGAAAESSVPQGLRAGLEADVEGLSPLFVPNEDYYRIDTALRSPQVDPDGWELRITGMVDNELTFTYDDLLARANLEVPVTLSCVSNEVGGKLVGNALWRGVSLRELLDEAGVQDGAEQIMGHSVDDWTGGFPLAHLDDPNIDALVAVAMNGEPLPVSHGFPARLVIAGLYGYVSATKWLSKIELTTWDDVDGYWISRGWSKEGPIKTQSRIDVPLRDDRKDLAAGEVAVAGVAWAPGRGIEKVEIQIDDGDWETAEVPESSSINEWRQWLYRWDATPGDHKIRVRATDGNGETQTSEIAPPAPNGATGHHSISVTVT